MTRMLRRRYVLIAILCFAFLWQLLSKTTLTLPEFFRDTVTLSLGVLYEAFPFVILGTILSSIVQLYIPSSWLIRILPKQRFFRRATLSLSGSVLPVCECGNVPLARGLMMKGIAPQDALTFILAAPIINPVTALTTHQAFLHQPLLLPLRLGGAFIIANLIGWLFDTPTKKPITNDTFTHACKHSNLSNANTPKRKKTRLYDHISRFSQMFQNELLTLLPALIGGSLLAGIVQTTFPRTWLTSIATQPVLAIGVMILLAFVVSICANVDAFFALSLSSIFPMSAILAFLVFGPMIDLKMLALLKTTYTKKVLIQVSAIVFLCSYLIGLGAHYVL